MIDTEIKTQKKKMTLYTSDASENGYVYNDAIHEYIYVDGMSEEEMEALNSEQIDKLLEECEISIWDNSLEWDCFEANFGEAFDKCKGIIVHGEVARWDGIYHGGRVYSGANATFDRVFSDLWRESDDMEITIEDGDMHIYTYNHDGGLSFVLRALTDDAVAYFDEEDTLSYSDLMEKVFGMGIKADKFLEGYI